MTDSVIRKSEKVVEPQKKTTLEDINKEAAKVAQQEEKAILEARNELLKPEIVDNTAL